MKHLSALAVMKFIELLHRLYHAIKGNRDDSGR